MVPIRWCRFWGGICTEKSWLCGAGRFNEDLALLLSDLRTAAAWRLQETAVSWLRKRLEQSTPKKCWEETREAYGRRLKRCCDDINKDCDVEGLCRGFPKRIKLLADSGGDCLPCKTLTVACSRIMKCCDMQ